MRSCASVGSAIDGRSRTGTNMLETYFSASKMLGHLRRGPGGPYLDGFAAALERQGYSAGTAVRYLRAAAHLGHVVARQGAMPSDIDLAVFSEHLRTCRCPRAMGGRRNHHTIFGARLFRQHLARIGVCPVAAATLQHAEPCLVADFKVWLRKHRGASHCTIKLYVRDAAKLMAALGDDPEKWEPAAIRGFFLDRASHCGNGTVEKLTTSLHAFLRYLAVKGRCRAGLADAVPGYAHWRLADLPRYLAAEQVNRLIAACDGEVVARRRDRAIILLLARLGLRAGDVAQLRLDDIEWKTGSLRVSGKSRYEVRLPLPQDVGDAIAAYLACRPSTCPSDHGFLRNIAPFRPFRNGDGVSQTPHAAGRHRGTSQGGARPATHGGDRDAAPWRSAREDRVG